MTHTATIRLKSLWGLRIQGPCSINDLADRTGLEHQVVHNAVYKLCQDGLAVHLGPASYDVTEAGKAFLAASAAAQAEPPPRERQLGLFE
jgi:predicted transcriptional regulator